jgi:Flp pilus assembly protein TadG
MTRWLVRRGDEGVSIIEVVLLTPVFLSFVLFIVAFGLVVDAKGTVNGAARDAARAGSLERSGGAADTAAADIARDRLRKTCSAFGLEQENTDFRAGGQYGVLVTCTVSLRAFSLIGIGTSVTVTGKSVAPLDRFRRTD